MLTIALWMRLLGATANGGLADRIGRKTPLMIGRTEAGRAVSPRGSSVGEGSARYGKPAPRRTSTAYGTPTRPSTGRRCYA